MDFAFAFSVIFTGIVIVFLVLLVLIAVMEIMGRVLGEKPKTPSGGSPEKEAPKVAAPAAPSPVIKKMEVEDGIGDEVVAVISAAIAAFTGGAGKPVAIRRAKSVKAAGGRASWSLAGLQENTQPF
ncbi:MAG: sodium pump decarboxylase subunit gamma [Provencibacterium sp.]|jgi:sodium pump decarboxylase gamma subunit|nr:sodium pump decarboxylase subunit gamma [Provencibacterium sp.]